MQNIDRYLFRGKRKDGQGWIEGLFYEREEIKPPHKKIYFMGNSDEDFEVDPSTVGQWVWCNDKNYTKLFVGDIYKRFNYIYLVEFDETERRYMGLCIGREKDFEKGSYEPLEESSKLKVYNLPSDDSITEIIGNRFDNLELLTLIP